MKLAFFEISFEAEQTGHAAPLPVSASRSRRSSIAGIPLA
jgi:hypothetical protein